MTQEKDIVDSTIEERGKIYGPPVESHRNIGLAWTAIIQHHYGITLDHPVPEEVVAQMMVMFKMVRACRVYHADNYVDAHAYTKFADEFQKPSSEIEYAAKPVHAACTCLPTSAAVSEYCEAMERVTGYSCTRPKGHEGRHVACNAFTNKHNLVSWPQTTAPIMTNTINGEPV